MEFTEFSIINLIQDSFTSQILCEYIFNSVFLLWTRILLWIEKKLGKYASKTLPTCQIKKILCNTEENLHIKNILANRVAWRDWLNLLFTVISTITPASPATVWRKHQQTKRRISYFTVKYFIYTAESTVYLLWILLHIINCPSTLFQNTVTECYSNYTSNKD